MMVKFVASAHQPCVQIVHIAIITQQFVVIVEIIVQIVEQFVLSVVIIVRAVGNCVLSVAAAQVVLVSAVRVDYVILVVMGMDMSVVVANAIT